MQKKGPMNLNKFNFLSMPLPGLKLPQNILILSLGVSDDGHAGVIFIELPEGSFIVKSSSNIPQELFFSRLGNEMGIRVPTSIFFCIDDHIHTKLLSAIEKYCKLSDECLFARLQSKFLGLFYLLMEYVPSITLANVGTQRFQQIIATPCRLHEIGVCLGYDLMICNNDRFQLLLGGEGNIDNFLIEVQPDLMANWEEVKERNNTSTQMGSFVLIDNTGTMSDPQNPNIGKYIRKVGDFVIELLMFLRKENQMFMENVSVRKLINQIKLFTGYNLEVPAMLELGSGVFNAIEVFLNNYRTGKTEECLQKLRHLPHLGFSTQQWVGQLSVISIGYCARMEQLLRPLIKQHFRSVKIKKNGIALCQ